MAQALASQQVSHRAAPATSRSGPRTAKSPRTSKPKLKVLNQQAIRQRARRRNALLVLFIVVLVGFFAVALVQAQLVADQQGLDVMRARIAEAEAENARMRREVEEASAPAAIVTWATENLGMVRAYQPVYLTAVAPIRDVPVAPAFEPERSDTFDLAAPQAATASSISAGIDGQASVSVDKPVAEVALTPPPANPISTDSLSVDPAVADSVDAVTIETAPAQAAVTDTASSSASVAGRSAVAGSSAPVAVQAGVVATTGIQAGSIAGTTAVAGGSGSG